MPSWIERTLGLLVLAAVFAGCGGAAETCEQEPSFFFQPGVSTPGITNGQATRISLASFCRGDQRVCPPTFDAAKDEIARIMAQASTAVVAGCGVRAVHMRLQGDLAGRLWIYDAATGALEGAATHDDTFGPFAGCMDSAFQAGEGPPLPEGTDPSLVGTHRTTCADVTTGPL